MNISIHHVGLTVLDLDESVRFFALLGFTEVGGKPDYPARFIKNGPAMLTLWRANAPGEARAFDRKQTVGLHHLALGVQPEELDELAATLAAFPGCDVEFHPEQVGDGPARHMMLAVPGSGLRLELRSAS